MALSTQQQELVHERLNNERKSARIGYLLWFFLGVFSAHRIYLGLYGTAAAQIFLFWGGLLLVGVLVGLPMIFGFLAWWIVDALLIGVKVDADASRKRARITEEVAQGTRTKP